MENYTLEFVHFDNETITDKFIDYLKLLNINTTHKCCNGKGVGINNIDNIDINLFLINFWNQLTKECSITIDINEKCSVCYEPTNKAINCQKPHFICETCFEQIKECPICRRQLIK
jgi:hypothetical protein